MNVICLEEKAFYELLNIVIDRFSEKKREDKWISGEEACESFALQVKQRYKSSVMKVEYDFLNPIEGSSFMIRNPLISI